MVGDTLKGIKASLLKNVDLMSHLLKEIISNGMPITEENLEPYIDICFWYYRDLWFIFTGKEDSNQDYYGYRWHDTLKINSTEEELKEFAIYLIDCIIDIIEV